MHELLELFRLIAAEVLDGSLLLLLLDVGVLLGLGAAGQALPREGTAQEVKDHMTDRLEVVSSGLLVAKVGVHRSVTGGTREILTVTEWDVLTVGRLEALGQTKVDDVDRVLGLVIAANQEIIRLNVTVDDALLVDDLDALNHLRGDVQDGFEVEFAATLLEQVLERLAEQVHYHDVIHLTIFGLLVTDEVKVGNCGLSTQLVDELGLPEKHDMLLVLHGLLYLRGEEVAGFALFDLVQLAEGTTAKFLDDLVPLVENLLSFFHYYLK